MENQVDLTGLVEFVSQAEDERRILLVTDDGSRLLVVVVADADGLPEQGQQVRVQGRLGSRCLRRPLPQALARLLHQAGAEEVAPDVRALHPMYGRCYVSVAWTTGVCPTMWS